MSLDWNMLGSGPWAALAAAAFGGIGVRLLDKMLSRRNDNFNESTRIRQELRDEVESLRVAIVAVRNDVDAWREKYWTSVEENLDTVSAVKALQLEIDALTMQNIESAQKIGELLRKLSPNI